MLHLLISSWSSLNGRTAERSWISLDGNTYLLLILDRLNFRFGSIFNRGVARFITFRDGTGEYSVASEIALSRSGLSRLGLNPSDDFFWKRSFTGVSRGVEVLFGAPIRVLAMLMTLTTGSVFMLRLGCGS